MSAQKRFESLQSRWRAADEKARALNCDLWVKYGDSGAYLYATKTERARVDRARAAADKLQDAIFTWLDAHSPRSWRSGVPCNWVCESLTYADAITTGRLSVTPPPAYGCDMADAFRFAAALPEREPVPSW